ncbi:MAG: hypothetical protein OEO77_09805 [Acidimicrobiia bacterium]|nr:hypothetical protein [Acidimicrobiia bacterium]
MQLSNSYSIGWVMDAVIGCHHYEEPVIFVREDWVSGAAYDPHSDNPNRWWNNGRGLPERVDDIADHLTRRLRSGR